MLRLNNITTNLPEFKIVSVRRFPLTAQLVDLGKLRQQNPFSRALYELLPNSINVLYDLDGNNPWQEVYVFLWNNKPVGMTSPSTIVANSEEGNWDGLPWWNPETKCLESPLTGNYLNKNEKALLWRWLENLGNYLHNYNGQPRAIDEISGLINEFRNSLGSYPEQALSISDNPQFFGVSLNRGVLNGINYPVKAEAQPSNVRLIASKDMGKVPDLPVALGSAAGEGLWREFISRPCKPRTGIRRPLVLESDSSTRTGRCIRQFRCTG